MSINVHVPFSSSRIIMSGLLLGIVLSGCIIISLLIDTFNCSSYVSSTNRMRSEWE